jgi:uncharacterized protein YigE (DUF2233 family)
MRVMVLRWFLSVILLFGASLGDAATAMAGCERRTIESSTYTACVFDPAKDRIEIFNLDSQGSPLGNFSNLRSQLEAEGKRLVFATNGGMFGEDLRPIGLYVEKGKLLRKLNRKSGGGNFHLKPNGVFYLRSGKAQVMDTEAFARANPKSDFATQSGPMLVINGQLHPKFSEDGPSMKIRNGVGVDADGKVHFVKSESAVNFHEFARLFRDTLQCRNALFLDGSISSVYSWELRRNDGFLPLGPLIGVYDIP